MAIYDEHTFQKRLDAAREAKKDLLEKFKARPSKDDPVILERQKARQSILAARVLRDAERERKKQERLAEENAIRLRQEAEREAERLRIAEAAAALEQQKQAEENENIAQQLRLEAEQKAKRDARYAARKARSKRLPPTKP